MSAATDGAELLYRQQYLSDQYELPSPDGMRTADTNGDAGEAWDIPLADIIEEEIAPNAGELGEAA